MKYLACAALAALLAIAGGCANTKASAKSETPVTVVPGAAATVAVAKAADVDLSSGIVLTGEFIPYQEIDVMAKVAGYVKSITVDIGDRVHQGQVLAELEVPEMRDEMAKAKAATAHAEAVVSRAHDEITRAESSHRIAHLAAERLTGVSKERPGLVAQQEIDDAQGKDLAGEAQVESAKANLDAALESLNGSKQEEARLSTLYDYTRVTAPFDGVITKRYADLGSMIQAGTASQTQAMPLVRLSQNSLLRLILPVPESAVPTVHIGQPVEVSVPTLHRKFPGRVTRFTDRLDMSTRTMGTEVDVPNPGLVLVPGLYAEVNLTTAAAGVVLSIPITAIDHDVEAGGMAASHVMVVNPQNRVEVRKVTPGIETADLVEIRSGLNPGDSVVVSSRSGLQNGQVVQPLASRPLAQ